MKRILVSVGFAVALVLLPVGRGLFGHGTSLSYSHTAVQVAYADDNEGATSGTHETEGTTSGEHETEGATSGTETEATETEGTTAENNNDQGEDTDTDVDTGDQGTGEQGDD